MNTLPRRLVLATTLAASSLALMAQPASAQSKATFTTNLVRKISLDYLLFLPRDYAAQPDTRWPLILFLHGAGERGSNVNVVATHGPPKIVQSQPAFPFIVVSPQCPEGQVWNDDTLLALLDDVMRHHRVDPKRVYLTGLSMGGYGTWSLGLAHPERFAAIVPICGGGDPLKVYLAGSHHAASLRRLPVWAFHGVKDQVVPALESQRMVDALRRSGVTEVELTLYPEADHDSWTATYDNPKLYDWLLKHSLP